MHTVKQLELALKLAKQLGYQVRHEWLDGVGGGTCEFGGSRWIFVDLALNPQEQLHQVRDSLMADPVFAALELDDSTRQQLQLPRAA